MYSDISRLCKIQTCIDNDLYKLDYLIHHLNEMCKLRDKELEACEMTREEWDIYLRSKQL